MIFIFYIASLLFTLLLTAIILTILIPKLKAHAKQPIYEGGPSWHSAKSGTPTMGGLAFLISICSTLTVSSFFLISIGEKTQGLLLLLSALFCALNSMVGIFDDMTKLKRKENEGLTPKQKLIFQFALCGLFFLSRSLLLKEDANIACRLFGADLGTFSLPLMIIIFVGIINFANLTDGIDGLASCVAFSIGLSLFYTSAQSSYACAMIATALIGATVGFLIFNLHPAKIFMGDTGSLLLGSLVAVSSLSFDNALLILPVSGVYIIEGVSVILQVLYYKATKKRLFKMAPLHHHLERVGFSENTICIIAIIATLILSIPTFIFS
jgi:phospho-N-acetylmuramoyl-pentapeptide-transferase